MSNQAISKVELQKLIDTKNSFVDLSVKYSLGINTDEFAKFPSFFDQRLTENQEQISSLGNELTETKADLQEKTEELEQTEISLQEKTEELQAKTNELEEFTGEVNTIKDGIADEVNKVESFYITPETPFSEYPQKVEQAISQSNRYGYNIGVNDEKSYWTELVNSTTATAENVELGKTFVNRDGEIESGTLDVETVKEEAEKDFLREFWNNIQQFGERTDYQNFGQVIWTKKNFKPTYDFRPANAYLLFSNGSAKYREQRKKDGMIIMKELEQEQGITFDFSNCTQFHDAFQNSPFIELNVIDLSKATYTGSTFYGGASGGELSQLLRRIERLICSSTTPFTSSTFGYASQFTYIGFEGIIAQNGLDLHWSTILDKESHIKLVNTLSSTTSGLSVTVSKTAVNKAFETSSGANDGSTSQEWLNLIATKSNWTISLS